MDIGTVVNIQIGNAFRSCVILGKRTYHELFDMWTNDMKYLREYHYYGGLHVAQALMRPIYLSGSDNHPIYQLLYGDDKVWVKGKMIEKHCGEI